MATHITTTPPNLVPNPLFDPAKNQANGNNGAFPANQVTGQPANQTPPPAPAQPPTNPQPQQGANNGLSLLSNNTATQLLLAQEQNAPLGTPQPPVKNNNQFHAAVSSFTNATQAPAPNGVDTTA